MESVPILFHFVPGTASRSGSWASWTRRRATRARTSARSPPSRRSRTKSTYSLRVSRAISYSFTLHNMWQIVLSLVYNWQLCGKMVDMREMLMEKKGFGRFTWKRGDGDPLLDLCGIGERKMDMDHNASYLATLSRISHCSWLIHLLISFSVILRKLTRKKNTCNQKYGYHSSGQWKKF